MIRRIELVNFMSHTHTVIEPAAGLTVLFGPNNCGKSAVVSALQILCHNENSTYVMRHGERDCSVTIETGDGHVVQWRRRNSPSYMVDGVPFDRLGRSAAPEELHKILQLPKVSAEGNQEFDVHFGEQKSPVFLVDKPGSHAAQFFASSSDAAKLVEMQKRHQQKSADAKREQAKVAARVANLSTDLENFKPIDEIGPAVAGLEKQYAELQQQAALVEKMPVELAELQRGIQAAEHHLAQSSALGSLIAAPVLRDTIELRKLIEQVAKTQATFESQAEQARVLQTLLPSPDDTVERALAELVGKLVAEASLLSRAANDCASLCDVIPLPALDDPRELRELIGYLRSQQKELAIVERRVAALSLPGDPPIDVDEAAITRDIQAIRGAQRDFNRLENEAREANEQQVEAAGMLRNFAQEHVCPTCGAALDPENLISHAGSHGAGGALG